MHARPSRHDRPLMLSDAGKRRRPRPAITTITSSSRWRTAPCCASTTPRRFGLLDYAAGAEALEQHRFFVHLGPEPLGNGFNGPVLAVGVRRQGDPDQGGAARSARRRRPRQYIRLREPLLGRTFAQAARAARWRARAPSGSPPPSATCWSAPSPPAGRASGITSRPRASWDISSINGRSMARRARRCPGCDCRDGIRRIVQAGRSTFYCGKRQR